MTTRPRLACAALYAAAFVVPVALLCVVAKVVGVYPFGAQSLLTEDLKYQYIDFYTWYKNVLSGDGSLFYSFSQSLGTNTWGQFGYYLGSPLNLLVLLFPYDKLTLFVFTIIALKLGLINCLFTWYFGRRFDLDLRAALVLALCVTWALWTATQTRNPIWLDALVWLPVMLRGVEAYVRDGSWRMLVLSTAASIISCWYTGYMTVLFTIVFYFFERYLAGKRMVRLKNLFGFGLALAAALGLSAFTFVPTVLSFLGDTATTPLGSAGSGGTHLASTYGSPWAWLVAAILLAAIVAMAVVSRRRPVPGAAALGFAVFTVGMLFLFFVVASKTSGRMVWSCTAREALGAFLPANWTINATPQLYCGFAIPLLCLAALFSRRVPARIKAAFVVLLGVMFLSFFVRSWYLAWCGFKAPNGFYCRNSIFFSLSMVWVAGYYVSILVKDPPRGFKPSATALSAAAALAVLVACADLGYTASDAWAQSYHSYSQEEHDSYVAASRALEAELDASNTETQPYRSSKTFTRADMAALNEGLAQQYLDISSYSSAHDGDAIRFLNGLGYSPEGTFSTRYSAPMLLMDSLLGVKYVCTDSEPAGFVPAGVSTDFDGFEEYENPYALGLGYEVSQDALAASVDFDGTPFERQNALLNALLGREADPYVELDAVQTGEGEWEVEVPAGVIGYYYVEGSAAGAVGVRVDGGEVAGQNQWFSNYVCALNDDYADPSVVRVSVANEAGDPVACDIVFRGLRMDVFEPAIETLAARQLEFTTFEDGHVEATFESAADGDGQCLVMLTVPYDDGWTVTVDGVTAELLPLFDGALSGLELPADGKSHAISMRYVSPGFVPGCVATAATAAALGGYALLERRRRVS